MNMSLIAPPRLALQLSPGMQLRHEGEPNHAVLLYGNGVAHLNAHAALILSLCDGAHDIETIVAELHRRLDSNAMTPPSTLAEDVVAFIAAARRCGWLVDCTVPAAGH